jgi:hypothetical protein
MLFGSDIELVVPLVVALISCFLWIGRPRLRRNAALRFALIVSMGIVTVEALAMVVLVFAVVLSGGMPD